MASVKSSNISVESFDSRDDFTLWQQRVKCVLTREGTINALKVKTHKTEKMMDEEWEDLKDMATSTISLCLANNTFREVIGLMDSIDI
jgi:hypothetical protein